MIVPFIVVVGTLGYLLPVDLGRSDSIGRPFLYRDPFGSKEKAFYTDEVVAVWGLSK
jgi:hypothetical protein